MESLTAPELGPLTVRARPVAAPESRLALDAARRLAALGRRGEAVQLLAAELDARPGFLEGERLLQDLAAGTRADAWLRKRFEDRRDRAPHEADASYLLARIQPSPAAAAALFEEALAADPAHPWARLGRAVSLERSGDARGALREAWRVAAEAPWLSLPWSWLGAAAWTRGASSEAAAFLAEASVRAPTDPRPWAGLAAAYDDLDRPRDAAAAAIEAIRRAPGDPAVLAPLGVLLERIGTPDELDAVLRAVEPARAECGDPAALDVFRGRILVAAGRMDEAERALLDARRAGASAGDVSVPLRVARIASGRPREAAESWTAELPAPLDAPEDADACAAPRAAVLALPPGEPDSPAAAVTAARALDRVGWGREASLLLRRASARWPTDPSIAETAASLAAFDAFLSDLSAAARDFRRRERRREDIPLADVFAAIRAASLARLGIDATEGANLRTFPLLGAYAASTDGAGPFRDVFESRGLLLVVGARSGRGAELMLGRLVSHRDGVRSVAMGREIVADEHVVETDGLPDALAGRRGGLAGVTLDRFVLIQLDVCRRAPPPEDADMPFLARVATERWTLRSTETPSDVAHRIERALVARGTYERDVLEAVLRHERVHVADARRLLPPWRDPVASLAFAVSHGFDAGAMERTLEARAAVGALADADEPRAALAALVGFLPLEAGDTPHVAGYGGVVQVAIEEILADPDTFASIDERFNVAQQMDRLTSAECRELGRRLSRRLWGEE